MIYSKKTGGKLAPSSLWSIYIRELKPYFTKLLDEAIGQDDRKQMEQLLLKPWNPYVIRHSTVTEYLVRKRRLSGNHANQWFGWKKESNMAARYEHFYGNEAEELLAESFGLKPEIKKESLPELRVCSNVNCKELNNPDVPFCRKCRGPLTIAGNMEEVNEREGKITHLEERMKTWENVAEKMKVYLDKRKKQEERQRRLYAEMDKQLPGWREKFHARLGRPGDEIVDKLLASVMPDQLQKV